MRIKESVLRDILRILVWFPFRWFVKIIPVNGGFFLFKLMGDMHFCFAGKKKRKIANNVKTFLHADQKTALDIVKKYYRNHYLDRLHIFLYPRLASKEKIEEYVYFDNVELLERELKRKKGILIVQPHFGTVQITLLALASFGYNPMQIGYPTDQGLSQIGRSVAYKIRLKYEAMLPPIIPAHKHLGKVYKKLVKGGIVLTTGDGAGGGVYLGEHKKLNILGTERMIPLGPAAWAIKTGASFIPTFIIVERYNRFRIIFEEPIKGIYNDIEKDKIYITEKFIAIMENYVKKYPYCWHFWDEI